MNQITQTTGTGTIIAPGGIAAITITHMTAIAHTIHFTTRIANIAGIIVTTIIIMVMATTCTFITFMMAQVLQQEVCQRDQQEKCL